MNIRAVAVLIAMPMAATQITVAGVDGLGPAKRRTASQTMAPTAISSSSALASDARIELRRSSRSCGEASARAATASGTPGQQRARTRRTDCGRRRRSAPASRRAQPYTASTTTKPRLSATPDGEGAAEIRGRVAVPVVVMVVVRHAVSTSSPLQYPALAGRARLVVGVRPRPLRPSTAGWRARWSRQGLDGSARRGNWPIVCSSVIDLSLQTATVPAPLVPLSRARDGEESAST